jgi:hypothetical protein
MKEEFKNRSYREDELIGDSLKDQAEIEAGFKDK